MKKYFDKAQTTFNSITMEEEVLWNDEFIIEFTETEDSMCLIMPIVNFIKGKVEDYSKAHGCCIGKFMGECPELAEEGYFTTWRFEVCKGYKVVFDKIYSDAKKLLVKTKANRKICRKVRE